jgi:hypothetical protein
VPAYGALIDHDEVFDDRRNSDSRFAEQDNQRLFDKWNLPDRNPRPKRFRSEHIRARFEGCAINPRSPLKQIE